MSKMDSPQTELPIPSSSFVVSDKRGFVKPGLERRKVEDAVIEFIRTVRIEQKAPHRMAAFSLTDEHCIKLHAVAEGLGCNKSETIRLLIDAAWEAGQGE